MVLSLHSRSFPEHKAHGRWWEGPGGGEVCVKLGGELGDSEVRAENQDVRWGEEGAGLAQHWAD